MVRPVEDFIAPENDFPPEVRAAARVRMLDLAGRYPDMDVEEFREARCREIEADYGPAADAVQVADEPAYAAILDAGELSAGPGGSEEYDIEHDLF